MKRKFLIITVLFLIFGLAASAGAVLTDNLDGTVTDDDRGDGTALMWLQVPGPDMNYDEAVAWADSLVFAGHDDWRLPSALDFDTGLPDETWNSVNNEFGHLYGVELDNPPGPVPPLPSYMPIWFWTETVASDLDAFAFFWSWDGLWLNQPFFMGEILHVTVVREDAAGPAVPEPSTMLLLGAGLVGLWGFRRKLRKG